MWRWFQQWWFLATLCLLLLIGLLWGRQLDPVVRVLPKTLVIAVVMLATSLATDFKRLMSGRGSGRAVAFAIAVNAFLAPPLGWLFSGVLPEEFGPGLVLTMCLPCTIASAIVWTQRGGGNEVATTVVSLATNFGCFIVLPFWTWVLLGQAARLAPLALGVKLLACVAAPMLLGQLVRRWGDAGRFLDARRAWLGLVSQLGVLMLAGVGAVAAGSVLVSGQAVVPVSDWGGLVVVAVAIHGCLLFAGYLLGRAAALGRPELLATVIAGAQKTMAVGLGVALDFGPLAIFPLVIYHFVQLILDTVVVDYWRSR